ncbi:hypothetical protein IFM89_001725 [Coptis chinensis]|uniref:Methyltransferase PMT26 n=1 Tax=Coptis chinensis TaxID=261450 RepID=A0A835HK25_9MAGN|nr:hypothetical protein IFM89_001725 [Coptis chinensis]
MAFGKNARGDSRKQSSSYCSTLTIVVFVALCLVGVWMMTSTSVVPTQNSDVSTQEENKAEVKHQVAETDSRQFEDNPGDLPEDAMKGDSNTNSNSNASEDEGNSDVQQNQKEPEQTNENKIEENQDEKPEDKKTESDDNSQKEVENDGDGKTDGGETKEGGDSDSEAGEMKKEDADSNAIKQAELEDTTGETKQDNKAEGQIEEKVEENQENKSGSENKTDNQDKNTKEVFPDGAQSEILKETTTQNGQWSTQADESKNEKQAQQSATSQGGYKWKVCNVTAGPDYIPCLDNWQAIRKLHSTKHYEHRERHCPEEGPTCLVPLPEGYRQPIEWPTSREKIWYNNIPHTKLAKVKGHQNWVKVSGEYLTFPGGGTQFKNGALHYIDFIQDSVSDIAWGKRTRVILDVGCGVASFGGFLFDRDVLTMSFAPKDEHEAQVQFALERGIPAISAVMGTKRLPYPGRVFDLVHCGKLLLELNRVLRPGGYFVWSATPVYQKLAEDVEIWTAMSALMKKMCWELVVIKNDTVNQVGAAIFRKPTSNECYEQRAENEPPLCKDSADANAAWNVPLEACMHKIPVDASERGSQWPEQWSARAEKVPYWLKSSQVGVYGKAAPEDFAADYEHWKRVVSKSYLNGMGISWSKVRNVMDMRSVYGGFAAALKDLNVWVMNVVPIDSPDTLPIIYERGMFGMYHDWCESFSTYPRSYDLLHADHIFSKIKKRCNLVSVIAEVDRILRPEGKLIVRDNVETISEVESMAKSMQWEIRLTFSKDKEGLLCVQKSVWRPTEVETVTAAIA